MKQAIASAIAVMLLLGLLSCRPITSSRKEEPPPSVQELEIFEKDLAVLFPKEDQPESSRSS